MITACQYCGRRWASQEWAEAHERLCVHSPANNPKDPICAFSIEMCPEPRGAKCWLLLGRNITELPPCQHATGRAEDWPPTKGGGCHDPLL